LKQHPNWNCKVTEILNLQAVRASIVMAYLLHKGPTS